MKHAVYIHIDTHTNLSVGSLSSVRPNVTGHQYSDGNWRQMSAIPQNDAIMQQSRDTYAYVGILALIFTNRTSSL